MLGRRNDKDWARRDVEETLSDAPEHQSGNGPVAAAPDQYQVGPRAAGQIGDLVGRLRSNVTDDLEVGIKPLV